MTLTKNLKRIVFLIGLYKVSQPLLKFTYSFYNLHMRERLSGLKNEERLQQLYGDQNDKAFALITGGSDGIGKCFALDLARSGFNLMLVSRSIDKLTQTAKECEEVNPKVQVALVPLDLALATTEELRKLFTERLQNSKLRILINNVGVVNPQPFFKIDPADVEKTIRLNVFVPTLLTKYALEYMKKFPHQNASIVHVTSFLGERQIPPYGLYAATKRFDIVFANMNNFSNKMISGQLRNVDTMIVKPSVTSTAMNSYANNSKSVKPEQVSYGVVRQMGLNQEIYGALKHEAYGNSYGYWFYPIYHQYRIKLGQKFQ